jgi:hypothetical protein
VREQKEGRRLVYYIKYEGEEEEHKYTLSRLRALEKQKLIEIVW